MAAATASSRVVIRDFRQEDDRVCKQMETDDSQLPRGLVTLFFNGELVQRRFFDFKGGQFAESFILVGEDPEAGVVCFINCAVKIVTLHWEQKPVKVLQTFNLLVKPDFRRGGLGRRLMDSAHQRGLKLGAKYASLAMQDSRKISAQHLFSKLGYKLSSSLVLHNGSLNHMEERPKEPEESSVHHARVSGSLAEKILSSEFKKYDQFPADLQAVVDSPLFLGTFVVCDKPPDNGTKPSVEALCSTTESLAVVSIWDDSGIAGLWVTRFIFPAAVIANPLFQVLWLFLVAICAVHWMRYIIGVIMAWRLHWAVVLIFLTFLLCPLIKVLGEQTRYLLALVKNKDGSMKDKARFFALARRGPNGDKYMELAAYLAKEYATSQGFFSYSCSLAEHNPLAPRLKALGCYRSFLFFRDLENIDRVLPSLVDREFHDPRES